MNETELRQRALELFVYDSETGFLLRRIDRNGGGKKGSEAGCICNATGYRKVGINHRTYYVHRIIWLMIYGKSPNQIDHINHNRLDNRLSNLSNVSIEKNQRNQKKHNTNTSGMAGLYYIKNRKRWVSQITYNGATEHLYYGSDLFEACARRKSAERQYGFHRNHGQ